MILLDKKAKRLVYMANNRKRISETQKRYYDKNKERINYNCREYYRKNRASQLAQKRKPNIRYSTLKSNARFRGLSVGITFDEYLPISMKPCHYCGKSSVGAAGHGLDRMDSSIGYEINNILPCCGSCNLIKNNSLSVAEMEAAMRAVLNLRAMELAVSE